MNVSIILSFVLLFGGFFISYLLCPPYFYILVLVILVPQQTCCSSFPKQHFLFLSFHVLFIFHFNFLSTTEDWYRHLDLELLRFSSHSVLLWLIWFFPHENHFLATHSTTPSSKTSKILNTKVWQLEFVCRDMKSITRMLWKISTANK